MDHGLAIETRVRDGLLRLAKDLQIPLLATNDSHYVMREDAPSQEHLLCINSGSTMDIPAGDGPGPAVRLQRRRLLPQVRRRDARDLA
jgi:DNA polymerase-3 subunit alpha